VKRVVLKLALFQPAAPLVNQCEHRRDVQAVVRGGIVFQIVPRLGEQSEGGTQAMTGGGPLGIFMHLQVHESTRELDERLEKIGVGLAAGFQPQILEHVVGGIKVAGIEAFEETEVARITRPAREMRHTFADPSALVRHAANNM